MTTTTEARLQELLDLRDQELNEAREQLEEFQGRDEDVKWRWARHRIGADDFHGLPLPRLQLLLTHDNGFTRAWDLSLVTADYQDRSYAVPLSSSTSNGGRNGMLDVENMPVEKECGVENFHFLPSLMTDLVRYSRQMPSVPAVVVVNGFGWQWIENTIKGKSDSMRLLTKPGGKAKAKK